MPLITCPDCGYHPVSDRAEACPKCGGPISIATKSVVEIPAIQQNTPLIRSPRDFVTNVFGGTVCRKCGSKYQSKGGLFRMSDCATWA